jgi:hypothetical protein
LRARHFQTLVIGANNAGRTIAYKRAKAHNLLSTLIEACASGA